MTTYVVIGAKRIQQWIARTPRLALTKGASQALTSRTSRDYLSGRLPEELRLIADLEDHEVLAEIVKETYKELPEPKPQKNK